MLDLPPRLADRYLVGAPIGQGAIAQVVRAVDDLMGRQVALKVLYPALRESPVVVERFRREVDLCRRIQDRHVLAIHEVVDSQGFLFLVMEYHQGGDLADRLAMRGKLEPAEVRLLARQLGGALAAAHRVGVVHRDVKPSNVLVGPGKQLDVRLCDFGLARSAEGSGLTASTAVLGTPEYMAPEVIAEGHADPRSDLYSLGVVLFEAATGRLPFIADSPYQMMRLALEERPPRAADLAPGLPADLEAALHRTLEKDPLDRFATAGELIDAFSGTGPAPATAALVPAGDALAPAPRARPPCPVCGGWLVEAAAACADCGHQLLRLEHEKPGVSILVTGPGGSGDKLDARKHVDLFRLLGELPQAGPALPGGKHRAAAPRIPFYVARQVSPASAERLIPRLRDMGLEARIVSGWALGPKEMRRKASTMGGRLVAGMGITSWGWQAHHLLPDGLIPPGWGWVGGLAFFGLLPLTFAVAMARSSSRALVSVKALDPGQPRRPAASTDVTRPLALALARLNSRQDRRLLAHLLDRLDPLSQGRTDDDAVRALTERAAQVASALAALEEADRASAEAELALPLAQAELRRLERGRVLLRSELLRLSAMLQALASARVRAGGAATVAQLEAARSATADLELSLEAERELEEFLNGAPASPRQEAAE